jgi:eukaryotic-like serine/threonine-protein kinase
LHGDWKAASQRLLALSRVNRFDDSDQTDNATRDLIAIAPTLAEAGEIDALRQFEEMLTDRLGRTNNPIAAEHVLKICLLLPPAQDLLTRLEPAAAVAQKSLPDNRSVSINRMEAWRCFALGLWNYRTGRFAQSVQLLTAALGALRKEAVVNACSLPVRSMAFQKLGQTANAQSDLADAKVLIEAKFSKPMELDNQGAWNDWLYSRILLREATRK